MDAITFIVSALVAGAAAGLKTTAAQTVRDAYDGIKELLQRRYGNVNLDSLERKPESKAQQNAVKETLADEGAREDLELLDQAKKVLEAVKERDPGAAQAVAVDVEDVETEFIKIKEAIARDVAVRIRGTKVSGGIDVDRAEAGMKEPKNPREQ